MKYFFCLFSFAIKGNDDSYGFVEEICRKNSIEMYNLLNEICFPLVHNMYYILISFDEFIIQVFLVRKMSC